MADRAFHVPHGPGPKDVPAADLGEGAPPPTPGFGEGAQPDVYIEEGDGDTLSDELRDRPTPPFRTPHPHHDS